MEYLSAPVRLSTFKEFEVTCFDIKHMQLHVLVLLMDQYWFPTRFRLVMRNASRRTGSKGGRNALACQLCTDARTNDSKSYPKQCV